MSIDAAKAEIRARRLLFVLSRNPWTWKLLSTDGTRHHLLRWDSRLKDVVCDACTASYGQNRCWARSRALEALKAEMKQRRAAVATSG